MSSTDLRGFAQDMAPYAPRSAGILTRLADDIDDGGAVGQLLLAHPAAGSPLFAVRALAGVQQLVLAGDAPELARQLAAPAADHAQIWASTRSTILRHPARIRTSLDRPVQQHQPERSAHLLRGLAMLGAPRVRLLELGACAGLNLVFDKYRWTGPGWTWGDPASPVSLTGIGPDPRGLTIVDRAGCDLDPRDPADPHDALVLRSFLPPEYGNAHRDLEAALTVAARSGVAVEQAAATDWLRAQLDRPAEPGVCTVVWHSLFWLYLDSAAQTEIEELIAHAARSGPVARIAFEPTTWTSPPQLRITV